MRPMRLLPRNREVETARMRPKPMTPMRAVGTPPTAENGLSRTREQLKYEPTSQNDAPAAAYHSPVR